MVMGCEKDLLKRKFVKICHISLWGHYITSRYLSCLLLVEYSDFVELL